MSFTKRTTLTDAGWTALTTAGATGIAQIQGDGIVRFHLGTSVPTLETVDYVTVWDNGLAEFPFLNAESGDILYGRSGGSDIDVSVVATGTAPA